MHISVSPDARTTPVGPVVDGGGPWTSDVCGVLGAVHSSSRAARPCRVVSSDALAAWEDTVSVRGCLWAHRRPYPEPFARFSA